MVDATIRRYQRQSQAAASAASGATVTRLEEVKELLADARLRALKRQRKLNDKLTGIEVSVCACVCRGAQSFAATCCRYSPPTLSPSLSLE